MIELDYYDAWYKGSLDLHKSVGILLVLLWLARVVWRCLNVAPLPDEANRPFERFEQKAAHLTHLGLYVLMLSLMLSGYLISTADGRGIDVFGLFEVPALPELVDKQEDVAGNVHFYLAWGLIVTISLHASAALKHHVINKDRTLKKMIKPGL